MHLQRRHEPNTAWLEKLEEAVLKYRLLHEHSPISAETSLHKGIPADSQRLGCRMCGEATIWSAMTDTLIQAGSAVKESGFRDVPGNAVLQAGPPGKGIYSGRPVSPYHSGAVRPVA